MGMIDFRCPMGHTFENFFHPSASERVSQTLCECGLMALRVREMTKAPAVVWTGPVGQRYRNRGEQGYHDPDGQWAYTRKGPDGKPCAPKAVRLETWQDIHSHCKREGLYDPREIPKTVEVGEDGKSISSHGFSGQEV